MNPTSVHDVEKRAVGPRSSSHGSVEANELDWVPIAQCLWRSRRMIVRGTFLTTVVVGFLSFLSPNVYESRAFLRFGKSGIPTVTYNSKVPVIFNVGHFLDYLHQKGHFSGEQTAAIEKSFKSPAGPAALQKSAEIAYDTEKSKLPEAPLPPNVLGLWITVESRAPEQAHEFAAFLGDYVKDCLLFDDLDQYIHSNFLAASNSVRTTENSVADTNFNIRRLGAKLSDLQQIKSIYPTAPVALPWPSTAGSEYISPAVLDIETQAKMAEFRNRRLSLAREDEMERIRLEFFTKANELLKNDKFSVGGDLFRLLQRLKMDFFKGQDLSKDSVKEVFNNISIELDAMGERYLSDVSPENRTMAGYYSAPVKVRPHRLKIIFTSFFLSLSFFIILALSREWWDQVESQLQGQRAP